jgi:hypothetical protein
MPLNPTLTPGSQVTPLDDRSWRLEIPAGEGGRYRVAQLDDYAALPRRAFAWKPPLCLSLRARASASALPGTWGFGLWNNPFSLSLQKGLDFLRLPSLPQAAWFFFASPQNYLSLCDELPAYGALATTFSSRQWPAALLALGAPLLPLLLVSGIARRLRRLGRRLVQQSTAALDLDPGDWHTYNLEWQAERVAFYVDNEITLETEISPHPPLGLVMWIDNQYAAFTPDGRLAYGTLPNSERAWIEITDLEVNQTGS